MGDFWEGGAWVLALSHRYKWAWNSSRPFQPSLCFSGTAAGVMEGTVAALQKGGGKRSYLFSLWRVIFLFTFLCLLTLTALQWGLSAKVLKFNLFLRGELIFFFFSKILRNSIYPWHPIHELETHTTMYPPTHLRQWRKRGDFHTGTCFWVNASFSFSTFFSGTVCCEERSKLGICICFSDSEDWNSYS